MTKSNSRVRRVKAWAILLDGELAHYKKDNDLSFPRTKKEAWRFLDADRGYDVVPLTISYQLPTKPKH